jgi:AcrR family transcriptional regulator
MCHRSIIELDRREAPRLIFKRSFEYRFSKESGPPMSLRPVKPPHETRTRILDAAEELFMQHGFEGTSMRLLTAKAGVNLAAVNYHFGSKHALIEAVFRRRLDPMNAARIAELERLETSGSLSPESIIRAFVGPSLRMIEDAKSGGRNFIRLLGRTYTDPAKAIRALIGQMYAPAMERYKAALERALPQMPRDELVWRMHFMFGTLAYTLAATDTVQLIAGCKPEDRHDARLLEERLTAFLAAGLHAPLKSSIKKAA